MPPSPSTARFESVTTLIPIEPATLTSLDVPPAAAMPQATKSLVWPDAVGASTAMSPPAVTCAPVPTLARFSAST